MKTTSRSLSLLLLLLCLVPKATWAQETFQNPVIPHNCPDPTILDDRARTGWFYAYSTAANMA